jgi:hypothetical protein
MKPYSIKQMLMAAETVTYQTVYTTDKCIDDVYEDPEEPLPPASDQH